MRNSSEEEYGVDFVIFLENVVRADCEIEDEDDEQELGVDNKKTGGSSANKKKPVKDRAKFFASKYGGPSDPNNK